MQLSDIKLGQVAEVPASTSQGPVQVIAVTGGKGGTGKTNIAVNLAQALANQGKSTLLLDADLGMANWPTRGKEHCYWMPTSAWRMSMCCSD